MLLLTQPLDQLTRQPTPVQHTPVRAEHLALALPQPAGEAPLEAAAVREQEHAQPVAAAVAPPTHVHTLLRVAARVQPRQHAHALQVRALGKGPVRARLAALAADPRPLEVCVDLAEEEERAGERCGA